MTERMQRRLRKVRERAAIRRWEYRQRHGSKGVWFRLRRVLTEAERAYEISATAMDELIAEGIQLEAVGHELEPPKRIAMLPSIERLPPDHARIELHLSGALLTARNIVLLPFAQD